MAGFLNPFAPTVLLGPSLVYGVIGLWRGNFPSIPRNWALCDGSNGTPDLRDRFLRAAGGGFNPGDSDGVSSNPHSFTGDGHQHTLLPGPVMDSNPSYFENTETSEISGTTDAPSTLPPFYSLLYIMYIG